MQKRLSAFILMATSLLPASAFAGCLDLAKGQPSSLSGVLTHHIFPGPPNFEDVQKGDTPEPGYILKLDDNICLTGDVDFADSKLRFDEVQLVPTDETSADMRTLRDSRVHVILKDPMPAMTGHHHRPLVAWVTAIEPQGDPTKNYGTAATTVEAFYKALETGDGMLAARFIIPEKTEKGLLSPGSLSRFYGNLDEPLELHDVHALADDRFLVRYRFRDGERVCDGRATVTTTRRDGRAFIKSIRADSGC